MPAISSPDRTAAIAAASAEFLRARPLTDWSIEKVATAAGCAKGLVLHHHGSKRDLLAASARLLLETRSTAWSHALSQTGIGAVDALFEVLTRDAREGWTNALLQLRAAGVSGTQPEPAARAHLLAELSGALGVPTEELPGPGVVPALLEGFVLALLGGAGIEEVREGYLRFWLSFVP